MTNMMPETVDVTSYIESGEYFPDSCAGRLDRLIKHKPLLLDESYEIELQGKLAKWKKESNGNLLESNLDSIDFTVQCLFSRTRYQYSFILTAEPIDVYRTDLGISINGNKDFRLFIGLDKYGKIVTDYQDTGWIINNCDSINSMIQYIYSKK